MRPLLLLVSLSALSLKLIAQPCVPVKTDFSTCGYTTVGHRGYSAVFPENTLLSIEEAFKRGVKYTEIDVSLTKDNKYVLFHDSKSIYRTTNGTGDILDYTLAELQQLDVGAWRGDQFKGTTIPTLIEALKLAEKYDAHLYLDLKNRDFNALKNSLIEAGVSPNRFLPSITTIEEAQDFRAILPQTPWIWYDGGLLPANINNLSFYTQCIQLGCTAFEVSETAIGDSIWNIFKTNVHNAGGKIWAFTVNQNSTFLSHVANGVDGLETDRPWEAARLICDGIIGNKGFDSLTTGNWIFSGNLLGTHIGSQLRPLQYKNTPTNQLPVYASCSLFDIPFIENQNKVVMRAPATDSANGLLVFPNFRIENNGIEDNSYTIIMDILMPTTSANKWISLFQTNTLNLNDGDFFINPSGQIGIEDSYHGTILPNTWYRIGFTVDASAGKLRKYINGSLVGTTTITGNRWDVWNSSRSGDDQGFLLFADNNGETAELYLSALQTRNYVLTPSQMALLGAPTAVGIKMGNADAWNATVDMAFADSTILDYENQMYYFVVPNQVGDSALLNFDLFGGATANVSKTKRINISNGSFSWRVTSQDGLQQKTWTACIRKTNTITALNEQAQPFKIETLYPNPASTQINLTNLPTKNCSYTITNIAGQLLQKNSFDSNNPNLDISMLSNGFYFITVTHNNQVATAKFVVSK